MVIIATASAKPSLIYYGGKGNLSSNGVAIHGYENEQLLYSNYSTNSKFNQQSFNNIIYHPNNPILHHHQYQSNYEKKEDTTLLAQYNFPTAVAALASESQLPKEDHLTTPLLLHNQYTKSKIPATSSSPQKICINSNKFPNMMEDPINWELRNKIYAKREELPSYAKCCAMMKQQSYETNAQQQRRRQSIYVVDKGSYQQDTQTINRPPSTLFNRMLNSQTTNNPLDNSLEIIKSEQQPLASSAYISKKNKEIFFDKEQTTNTHLEVPRPYRRNTSDQLHHHHNNNNQMIHHPNSRDQQQQQHFKRKSFLLMPPSADEEIKNDGHSTIGITNGKNENDRKEIHYVHDRLTKTTYIKGKLLGKGGFAKCYKLTQLATYRTYAAKVISKSQLCKSSHRQQVYREIEIHKPLLHPNIVNLCSSFEDEFYMYIVLEYCDNKTLVELIKDFGTLSEDETRYFMRQIVSAVTYLHGLQILHRDLKLGNMFLTRNFGLKVGDFGLSTKITEISNKKISICGTPNYIAPEILSKTEHSYPSDVWAIGCIMYAMLCGKPPFESDSLPETYNRISRNVYKIPQYLSQPAHDLIRKFLIAQPTHRISLYVARKHLFFQGFQSPLPSSILQERAAAKYKKEENNNILAKIKRFSMPANVAAHNFQQIDSMLLPEQHLFIKPPMMIEAPLPIAQFNLTNESEEENNPRGDASSIPSSKQDKYNNNPTFIHSNQTKIGYRKSTHFFHPLPQHEPYFFKQEESGKACRKRFSVAGAGATALINNPYECPSIATNNNNHINSNLEDIKRRNIQQSVNMKRPKSAAIYQTTAHEVPEYLEAFMDREINEEIATNSKYRGQILQFENNPIKTKKVGGERKNLKLKILKWMGLSNNKKKENDFVNNNCSNGTSNYHSGSGESRSGDSVNSSGRVNIYHNNDNQRRISNPMAPHLNVPESQNQNMKSQSYRYIMNNHNNIVERDLQVRHRSKSILLPASIQPLEFKQQQQNQQPPTVTAKLKKRLSCMFLGGTNGGIMTEGGGGVENLNTDLPFPSHDRINLGASSLLPGSYNNQKQLTQKCNSKYKEKRTTSLTQSSDHNCKRDKFCSSPHNPPALAKMESLSTDENNSSTGGNNSSSSGIECNSPLSGSAEGTENNKQNGLEIKVLQHIRQSIEKLIDECETHILDVNRSLHSLQFTANNNYFYKNQQQMMSIEETEIDIQHIIDISQCSSHKDKKRGFIQTEDPIYIWVTKWVDYAEKFGFGYQLSDGTKSVLFKDGSRIQINDGRAHLYDKTNNTIVEMPYSRLNKLKGELSDTYNNAEFNLEYSIKDKISIYLHFANFMERNLIDDDHVKSVNKFRPILLDITSPPPRRYIKMKKFGFNQNQVSTGNTKYETLMMRFNDGTIQINFLTDHIKMIIGTNSISSSTISRTEKKSSTAVTRDSSSSKTDVLKTWFILIDEKRQNFIFQDLFGKEKGIGSIFREQSIEEENSIPRALKRIVSLTAFKIKLKTLLKYVKEEIYEEQLTKLS